MIPKSNSIQKMIQGIILAWFTMVGIDFFLHGGLLEEQYQIASPFLLSLEEAFARIPYGYLSFLIMAVMLVGLIYRLEIRSFRAGFRFGLLFGGLSWGAWVIGLYSISTAPPTLLVWWLLGQTAEVALAGGVVGMFQEQGNFRRILVRLFFVNIGLILLTGIIQNI